MKKTYRIALATALAVVSLTAGAQSWGPLNLEELKQETQRRADRNLPPLAGIKPDDARVAVAALTSLEPDV